MELFTKLFESATRYASFFISFVLNPRETMSEYGNRTKIDPDLGMFLLFALGLSGAILIVAYQFIPKVFRPIAEKSFVDVIGDYKVVTEHTFAVLLIVLVATPIIFAFAHGCARFLINVSEDWPRRLSRDRHRRHNYTLPPRNEADFYLGGSVWDTVNAGLGFVSCFVPVLVLLSAIGFVSVYRLWPDTLSLTANIAPILVATLGLIFYFPKGVSGTHRGTSYFQALMTLSMGLVFVSWPLSRLIRFLSS